MATCTGASNQEIFRDLFATEEIQLDHTALATACFKLPADSTGRLARISPTCLPGLIVPFRVAAAPLSGRSHGAIKSLTGMLFSTQRHRKTRVATAPLGLSVLMSFRACALVLY